MARSVLERYGGFPFLSRVVMAFYDKVLDSDVLAPYFEDVDMRRLIDHQTKFMAFLMGGPASYTNEHLGNVHAHLGIDRPSFDVMVATMQETLEDFEMEEADVATVLHGLHSRAPWIITGPQAAAG
ncbi:MAG: group 1 truncated hemoglobin [Chloroflexota bacterium]|jgi:hemoglobin|nr:group 1 truncated hemoglobin [Chloroflexota bacterium]